MPAATGIHDVPVSAGSMALRLSIPGAGTASHPLQRARVVLGRSADVEIPIESDTVSRRHAELVKDPFGRWWIRDLASRNGTRVNGEKVSESLVEPGDVIQLGECTASLCPQGPIRDAGATVSDAAQHTIVDGMDHRVQRLRELEAPRIEHSHLASIVEFGHGVNTTQDRSQRLGRLCALMLSHAFRGRSVAVLQVPRNDPGQARVISGPQVASGAGPQPSSFSRSVLRAVCETPEPVMATNTPSNAGAVPLHLTMPSDVMAMTVIAAPLRHDEQDLELLYMTLPPECSSSDWLALVALAVKEYQQAESIWLNVGKIREYAVIRRELERAQQIQRRLVPRNLARAGLELAVGFRPCQWVGGDCVAVAPMANGRVLLAVADVCGKGLSAALVASCVHTLLHSGARAGQGLCSIVSALNDYLCEYLGIECFATMLCVAIDPATGDCESVCAGHPRGMIVNPLGQVRALSSEANCPMGIVEQVIQSGRDRLLPGEALMLFSDGLIETRDPANRMLGEEGLQQGVLTLYPAGAGQPLAGLVEQIERCLDAFQGSVAAQDDQTFLLARLKS